MKATPRETPSSTIPSYELYGEDARPAWESVIHFEPIQYRSAMHDFDITPHVHDGLFQVLYLQGGSGETFIDGVRWPIRAGSLVVVPATYVHGHRFSADIDGPVVTAAQRPVESLAAVAAPALLATIRAPAVIDTRLSPRHAEALMPLFDSIEREAMVHSSGHAIAGTALLVALFVQIARIGTHAVARSGDTADTSSRSRKALQIERFRALVDVSFRERLSMVDYAARLGISAGQLNRICREILGVSSLDIVNARVIHEAQRELAYSSSSIKEIAGILGFVDEAYFGRLFRKNTGLTPTKFREKALTQLAGQRPAD